MSSATSIYIPMDRRHAMAQRKPLPDRVQGVALFADISGFTPLTEALVRDLGPQRGAEELTEHLNRVYDALITELHKYGGSVIKINLVDQSPFSPSYSVVSLLLIFLIEKPPHLNPKFLAILSNVR